MSGEGQRKKYSDVARPGSALEAALASAVESNDIVEVHLGGRVVGAVVPPSLVPRLRRARRLWLEQDAALRRVRLAFADIDPEEIERHLSERDDELETTGSRRTGAAFDE